jgi:hypothetical protein
LASLVTVAAVMAAVLIVPSSADALPVFEFPTKSGPVKISASQLGARRIDGKLSVDDVLFDRELKFIAERFRTGATPATYTLVDGGHVVMKPGSPGYELDPAATKTMLLRALRGSRSNLKLPLRSVAALPGPAHAIVVHLSEFRLDLYKGSDLEDHFLVGIGAARHATPPGAYYIKSMSKNPTWRNPYSSWSRGMPAYIAPGPRNPLGTRAMRLDRGALVIHGTPQPWSVGHRSSHGCIRMRKADVERLFDEVSVNTPVFIVN